MSGEGEQSSQCSKHNLFPLRPLATLPLSICYLSKFSCRQMIRCKDYIKQELNRLESTLHCLPTTSIFYQLFWLLPKNSNATMFFSSTFLLPLFMLAATSAYGQQFQDPENQAPASTSTELDTSEPTLWQMAAFAARQMSTKTRRFKLATLTSAEQTDSLFRLKVTLQRVNQGAPIDSKVSCCPLLKLCLTSKPITS